MKIDHELKIWPCYFKAVVAGDKTFEIRDNSDRGFQKGDIVRLREWDNNRRDLIPEGCFTGEESLVQITYVTNAYQNDEYVVFGFKFAGDQSLVEIIDNVTQGRK